MVHRFKKGLEVLTYLLCRPITTDNLQCLFVICCCCVHTSQC